MNGIKSFQGAIGAFQLGFISLVIQFFSIIPLWVNKDSLTCKIVNACISWIPFVIMLWNMNSNYFYVPFTAYKSKKERKSEIEKVSLVGAMVSFFFYLVSWSSLFLTIWAFDTVHSFENLDPSFKVTEMWIKFIALSFTLGNGGGFTSLVPENIWAQGVASFIGFNGAMIIIVGFGVFVIVAWERVKERSSSLPNNNTESSKKKASSSSSYQWVFNVFINVILTCLVLLPLIINKDSETSHNIYYCIFWIPIAFNLWNLFHNYVRVIYDGKSSNDSNIGIWDAMVSYHLFSISVALLFLIFWIHDPAHSWHGLDPTWNVFEAWFRFVCTSTLISVGGEFMYEVPISWQAQIVAGSFCYIYGMLIVSVLVSIVGFKWDVLNRKK